MDDVVIQPLKLFKLAFSLTKEIIWKEGKLHCCPQVVPYPPDVNPPWRCVLVKVVNFVTSSARRKNKVFIQS